MLCAYDFARGLAATPSGVSEKAIRESHELVCAGQETFRVMTSVGWQERLLPEGEYKDLPNNPDQPAHRYCPCVRAPDRRAG